MQCAAVRIVCGPIKLPVQWASVLPRTTIATTAGSPSSGAPLVMAAVLVPSGAAQAANASTRGVSRAMLREYRQRWEPAIIRRDDKGSARVGRRPGGRRRRVLFLLRGAAPATPGGARGASPGRGARARAARRHDEGPRWRDALRDRVQCLLGLRHDRQIARQPATLGGAAGSCGVPRSLRLAVAAG